MLKMMLKMKMKLLVLVLLLVCVVVLLVSVLFLKDNPDKPEKQQEHFVQSEQKNQDPTDFYLLVDENQRIVQDHDRKISNFFNNYYTQDNVDYLLANERNSLDNLKATTMSKVDKLSNDLPLYVKKLDADNTFLSRSEYQKQTLDTVSTLSLQNKMDQ